MAAPTIFPDVETETETDSELREERKYQPPYHVILINDDDHSYEYVIVMLKELFADEVRKIDQAAEAESKKLEEKK